MLVSRSFRTRNVAVVIIVLFLATTTYASAAANVVGKPSVGEGWGTISGYTIADVVYTLNASNPEVLDAVDFDITAAAGASDPTQVLIQLDASTSTWYSCTAGVSPAWSCDTTGTAIGVADMDILNVVATE